MRYTKILMNPYFLGFLLAFFLLPITQDDKYPYQFRMYLFVGLVQGFLVIWKYAELEKLLGRSSLRLALVTVTCWTILGLPLMYVLRTAPDEYYIANSIVMSWLLAGLLVSIWIARKVGTGEVSTIKKKRRPK